MPRGQNMVQPLPGQTGRPDNAPEVNMIREKLAKIYEAEPNAAVEKKEVAVMPAAARSKHQEYMYQLNHSGKSMAQIQVEWHNYYQALPDDEKHQVWTEFYASNKNPKPAPLQQQEKLVEVKNQVASAGKKKRSKAVAVLEQAKKAPQTEVGKKLQKHVLKTKKVTKNRHFQSVIFGLGMGLLATVLFLFSFFNERIIAPFIQPSRNVTNTPLIVSPESVAAGNTPQIIIPKINVEIPVIYQSDPTESVIESFLDQGVVHYPTTSSPGQNGNTVVYGHSSNNIFNKGQYKFAFVLLHLLQPGDTFYLTKDGKVYVYKVFSKRIVEPTEVSVLLPVDGHQATATLITCDPPGTSLRRLIIVGDQVSPDVSGNTAAAPVAAAMTTTDTSAAPQLAGNGKTLWYRFTHSSGWIIFLIIIAITATMLGLRRMNRRGKDLGF